MWTSWHRRILVIASILGVGISAYLGYTKISGSSLVCVGRGCEIVNSSPYAAVMGIPVAFLGLGMYLLLLLLAIWEGSLDRLRTAVGSSRSYISPFTVHPFLLRATIFAIALAGTIYSAYLTAIELFWLRAICSWCVASAVLVTLIAATSAHGLFLGHLE
ncbi:MAG: vitamin K epoxide reductase family protein [Armatimonadota bacterium]|nr:vitamin K epoxide reductase family protein [Armatimonadota bacterium]